MPDDAKKEPGRPPWQPTEKDMARIQGYAEAGFTIEQIAERFEKDRGTITKHCGGVIKFARMDLLVSVARNAYRAALGAPAEYDANNNLIRAEVLPQAWAICFILKTIGRKVGLGFNERDGKGDGPQGPTLADLLPKMTPDELAIIDQAQGILARYAPEVAGALRDGETAH